MFEPAADLDADVDALRALFPALDQTIRGRPLVYLDSAATALTPRPVIDAMRQFRERGAASPRRAVHTLAARATAAYEAARAAVAGFVGGASDEVVFTRGTTEALNLVALSWARPRLGPGDQILVTALDHHANFIPWQRVAAETGATLVIAPLTATGAVDVDALAAQLGPRTRVVACPHASNVLGAVVPVAEIAARARAVGAIVVVDGAQGAPHLPVDVAALGCDFYALSGHKLYGPDGVGALWGRRALLAQMPPWQSGGGMIREVRDFDANYDDPPHRFEAGTPNVVGAIGLGAAIAFLDGLDRAAVRARERALTRYAEAALRQIPGVGLIGGDASALDKIGVISFAMDRVHPHDIGTLVDGDGVAIRTGHHCAQPLMRRLGVDATARASIGVYTRRADIDALADALRRVREVFP